VKTETQTQFLWVNEYLEGEKDGQIRHEYVAGQVYAMIGGSIYHNRIAGNSFTELKARMGQSNCDVFMADIKRRTEHAFYYPDLMVVCDPADTDPYIETKAVLIIEVISPNSRSIDEREKRLAYQNCPTVQEYLLAEQDRAEVRLIRRTAQGWEWETFGPGDLIRLQSLNTVIAMQAIYERVWR